MADKQVISLWGSANPETQRVYGITFNTLLMDIKLLYLLSDIIYCPVGSVFESKITQQVFNSLMPLFSDKKIYFTVKYPLSSYKMYVLQKQISSALSVYSNHKQIAKLLKDLERYTNLHVLRSGSLNSKIVDKWCMDFDSEVLGSVNTYLKKSKPIISDSYIGDIINISRDCEKDLDWNYVYGLINRDHIPTPFYSYCQKRLSQIYITLSAESMKATLDRQVYAVDGNKFTRFSDIDLFWNCLGAMGLLDALLKISPHELIELANHPSYIYFRHFYLSLLKSARLDAKKVRQIIVVSKTINDANSIEQTILTFLSSIHELTRRASVKYNKPIDILKNGFDLLGKNPINEFIKLIMTDDGGAISNNIAAVNDIKSMEDNMISLFISHSSIDIKLSENFVYMLKGCLGIESKFIRCSSVPGFKYDGLIHVSTKIKSEISDCRAVVGIITKNSLKSSYVIFELGAGWLLGKAYAFIDRDVEIEDLPGPLKENHILKIHDINDLRQFIDSIAAIGVGKKESVNVIETTINKFIETLT